jgi:hypothetical protein
MYFSFVYVQASHLNIGVKGNQKNSSHTSSLVKGIKAENLVRNTPGGNTNAPAGISREYGKQGIVGKAMLFVIYVSKRKRYFVRSLSFQPLSRNLEFFRSRIKYGMTAHFLLCDNLSLVFMNITPDAGCSLCPPLS